MRILFCQCIENRPVILAALYTKRHAAYMHPASIMEITNPAAVFVAAVLVAVACQAASNYMRLPAIALWLAAGMLLGPYGFHLLHIEAIRPAIHTLIELGLAIILFEGGLNLNLRGLKEQGSVVSRLLLFSPLMTMLIGGGLAHSLTDLSWNTSLLFGALVSVGGPTVIIPIVRQTRLERSLRHVLTSEAMLVDATGAILAIVMLQLVLVPGMHLGIILQHLLTKFAIGGIIGWAGGWLLAKILSGSWLRDMELRSTATLAFAWGLFILADHISAQAGLLAVLVAGARLQKTDVPGIERVRHFKASLSILLVSVLFVLLAADLNLSTMMHTLWPGLLIFAALALVARPVSALLSGVGSSLNKRHIAFLAFMAPRGVVAAAITALFGLILQERSIPGSQEFEALVYIVIIVSVLLYGFMASPLARWLKVEGGDEHSVLIIGGGQIGAELGRVLSEKREVRFLDLNAEVISNLQRSGYTAVRGNALDPLYMEIVHAEEVGTAVVMTGSSDHNLLIARLAKDEFHVPEIYVTLQEDDEDKHSRLMHQIQAKRLFAKPYSFTYWNDQAYRKRLIYETRRVEDDSDLIGQRMADMRIPHGVQPMAIMREDQAHLPYDDFLFEAGDDIVILLRPERIQEGQPLILPPTTDHSGVANNKKTA